MDPATIAILLSMQAAGMVTDWFSVSEQKRLGRMGSQIEQAGINANIELTRAQTEEASAASMSQLRQSIGSQIAIQAARGTSSGAGSAVSIMNESLKSFNDDERARRMNLLSKEANLRAQGLLSGLHQLSSETQMGQQLRQRFLNSAPMSALLSGATKGAGTPAYLTAGQEVKSSYGMTSVS